ncbi:MAG: ATP-binding protein [Thermodesulfovibrio sp.]|uniref:ATP-binding response regulator n=1 Tax=Thermodesulfovibrio sp. N1 TaxID=1871110 RepID=UPI00083AB85A|nr:ATP-binding protein [Thermodesulfovibrio sp. N1]MDI6713940.1 ATP-binding protein [Thermodesulfovibrio sp.]ODA44354.1 sensory box histidine kinase/response regulator [Thermodesulfovibrio sp. N1]
MENHPCPYGGYLKCKNFFCEYGNALSEVLHYCCDVLEKIAQGDTSQKIDIVVERNAVQKLINSINKVSEELSEIIELTHELAIGICEHFDVLRRLQEGDFSATASEDSSVEVVRMLGQLINKQRDRFVEYINKIKEQHQELIQSYEQQKTIISSIGVAVIVVEEDMTIEYVNEEFESLTGYTKKEVEGKMKWTEFIAPEMLHKMIEYHKLRRINPSLAPRQYESKLKDRNGKIKDVLLNVEMLPYTKKSIASIIDISERKKIQEQLIHSQKMESLGFLSGRVAHEFNNILTAVLGFSGILYSKIEDPQLKNYVQKIIEASERARDLSKKLLLFSRKEESKEDIQEISLNKFLNEFSEFLKPVIGKDIELKINLPEEEIFYKIDRTHLEVIFMNLVTNARDAMPKGGELSICLKRVSIDAEYSYTHPLVMPGEYLLIILSDTGIGMDEQTKQKIFEPFFTTKPKGKGTGLGLSTVFGLVKKYNGHIHVYSEISKGTTFKIYLPIKETKLKHSIDKNALKGLETILIVDDDEQTRGYISSMLKDYGYKVYEAKDGQEALKIFERNKDQIALSLVDLIMPGIPGIEVMRQIKKIKPEAKVIIISGHPVKLKNIITVEKTISPEEILFKIRNMIDGKE